LLQLESAAAAAAPLLLLAYSAYDCTLYITLSAPPRKKACLIKKRLMKKVFDVLFHNP
jgi:hypothetical protein